MNKPANGDLERRVEARARRLWDAEGRPPERMDEYRQRARQLIAIEDNPDAGTQPLPSPTRQAGRPWIRNPLRRSRTRASFRP